MELIRLFMDEVSYLEKKVENIEKHLNDIFLDISLEFGMDYNSDLRDIFYETLDKIRNGEQINDVKLKIFTGRGWNDVDILIELEELKYFILGILFYKIDSKVFSLEEEKLERMLIRIILLKNGWDGDKIEKLLVRHYGIKLEKRIQVYYYCLKHLLMIEEEKFDKRGRPKIPIKVDKILKIIRERKNKERMRNRYEVCNILKREITIEDLNKIKLILEKNGEEGLSSKIDNLLVYVKK